jgi:cytoskeletal protein CcmA (bactofilin family)
MTFRRNPMARDRSVAAAQDSVISIIGPGMSVVGDCETDGTLRVEGRIEGTIRAGKAVVVGKDGEVSGKIFTQDAILAGRVQGSIHAASRLEVQATARIDAEVRARRMQLEEGAEVNGTLIMGEQASGEPKAGPQKMPAETQAKVG